MLAYISMALTVLALTVPWKVGVGDTWTALVQGRYIVEHGLPSTDPFSYTAPTTGKPLIIHEWLSNIAFFLVYNTAGIAGLVALKVLLVSLTLACTVHAAVTLGASVGVTTAAFPALLFITAAHFDARMFLFSSLFLSAYWWLYVRVRQGKVRPHWLWLIGPVHALWANMHGGHIQGIALLAVFAMGEGLAWLRARYQIRSNLSLERQVLTILQESRPLSPSALGLVLLLPLLAVLGACLTPYGPGLLFQPFREAALERGFTPNTEWLALYQRQYHNIAHWAFLGAITSLWWAWMRRYPDRSTTGRALPWLAVLLGLAALAIAIGHNPRGGIWGPPVAGQEGYGQALLVILAALLGIWAVHAVRMWRSVDLVQAGVVVLFVAVSFAYVRAIPDTTRLLFPIVTATLSHLMRQWHAPRVRRERRLVLSGAVLMLGVMLIYRIAGEPDPTGRYQQLAMGWGANVSLYWECAGRFFERHRVTGHVAGTTAPMSWLLFRLWPSITVHGDGRLYAYGGALIRDWASAIHDPDRMQDFLARFPTDFIMLNHRAPTVVVYQRLVQLGWVFVFESNGLFIMAHPTHTALIQEEGYRHILAWQNLAVTPANAPAVLREADRALQACPAGASFAHAYRAKALRMLGRESDVLDEVLKVPKELWIE
jgi:hypothetical protein